MIENNTLPIEKHRMRSKPKLGEGIYTIPEAARILNLPTHKVGLWIKNYWELDFIKNSYKKNVKYTWGNSRDRGFNFYTLIEIIAVKAFRDLGVSFRKIKEAHEILASILKSPYPFANSRLLSDGKDIFLDESRSNLLGLDQKLQYSFKNIVEPYCKKLEFNPDTNLANRYWPLGKDSYIVVDPHHSFGQPTIVGTNISIYTILKLIQSGETKEFVTSIFEVKPKAIEDVLLFCNRAAA